MYGFIWRHLPGPAWLKAIEDDGTWGKLWKVCIGDRTAVASVPKPPAIGA